MDSNEGRKQNESRLRFVRCHRRRKREREKRGALLLQRINIARVKESGRASQIERERERDFSLPCIIFFGKLFTETIYCNFVIQENTTI